MPDASVSLGLNAAELYTEINQAVAKFQSGVNRMGGAASSAGGGINALSGAHDRLFTSSHRVANRVGALADVMVRGGDAASVFGAAIEGAGRSLNLSLGALAGIAAVGVLFVQLGKSYAEAEKLRKELSGLLTDSASGANFSTFDELEKRLESIRKKVAEIQTHEKTFAGAAISKFSNFDFASFFGGRGKGKFAGGEFSTTETKEAARAALPEIIRNKKAEAQELAFQNIQKEKKARDIPGSDLTPGAFSAERATALHEGLRKIREAFKNNNLGVAARQFRAMADSIAEINQKEQEQVRKHEEILQVAKETTAIQALELAGDKDIAAMLKIEFDYRHKINDALRVGNKELADQLENQKAIAQAAAAREKNDREASQQRKTPAQKEEDEAKAHDRQAVANAEADTAANTRKLARDQKIDAELANPNLSQDRRNELISEKFSRQHGAHTPEEQALQNEANDLNFRQGHGGLTPAEQARGEQINRKLFGDEQIDKEKATGAAADPSLANVAALQREREELIRQQAISKYGARGPDPNSLRPGEKIGRAHV